jgi:hypothetical protein
MRVDADARRCRPSLGVNILVTEGGIGPRGGRSRELAAWEAVLGKPYHFVYAALSRLWVWLRCRAKTLLADVVARYGWLHAKRGLR